MTGVVEYAGDDLTALVAAEREADEWRAVEAIVIDESDFIPMILPEDVSEAFEIVTTPAPMRARLSTGVDGWVVEED